MQARGVAGDRVAQLGQTEVVRIEGLASRQRLGGRLANRGGRDLVALAEPEGEHIVAADAGIGDFANLRSRKVGDHGSHWVSLVGRVILQLCAGSSASTRRTVRKP